MKRIAYLCLCIGFLYSCKGSKASCDAYGSKPHPIKKISTSSK